MFCCLRTALAEAELEYNDSHISPSIYVKFKLSSMPTIIADHLSMIFYLSSLF